MEEVTQDPKTGDKTTTSQPKVIYAGGCEHYFVEAGPEESGLRPYKCRNCPNGILVDKDHKVIDGKLNG